MHSKAIISIIIVSLTFAPLSLTGRLRAPAIAVNQAHAIFVSAGVTFDPANLARMILEYVANNIFTALLEQAKQKALQRVNTLQLDFLRGPARGLEKIVTNWPRELQLAFNTALDAFMREADLTEFCDGLRLPAIGGLIALRAPQQYAARFRCTFDNAFGSLNSFITQAANYPDFAIRYATTLRPENNPFTIMVQTQQLALEKSEKEEETTKAKFEAGKGVKPTQDCDVPTRDLSGNRLPPLTQADYALGEDYWKPLCETVRDTTPGGITADQTSNNLDSSNKYTVNMQAVGSAIGSLITNFISKALVETIFTQVIPERGLLGPPLGSVTDADPCEAIPASTPEYYTCLGLNGDLVGAKARAVYEIDRAISSYNQALPVLSDLFDCQTDICQALNPSSPSTCTEFVPPMKGTADLIQRINDAVGRLTVEKARLAGTTDISAILTIINSMQGLIADAQSQLDQARRNLTSCQNERASLGAGG